MKGIIYKDLYETFRIKMHPASWIFSIMLILASALIFRSRYIFILNALLTLPSLGVAALEYSTEQDEIARFDRIQTTFPVSVHEIVLAKYFSGILLDLIGAFVSLLFLLLYVYVFKLISMAEALPVLWLGTIIGLVFLSVGYAGYFLMGYKRGTVLYICTLLVLAALYIILFFLFGTDDLIRFSGAMPHIVGILLAVGILLGSFKISCAAYKRRHG